MKKQLFIIAGANGVGKTTLAREFLKDHKVKFLNADEIYLKGRQKKSRITAGKIFLREFYRQIINKRSFAIESTLAGKSLARVLRGLKKNKYRISVIYFFVDNPEVAINRIKIRVEKGGHSVPDADVRRRFYRSQANFWDIYRKIADEWSILYNGDQRIMPVAAGNGTEVDVVDESLMKQFFEGTKH